MMKKTLQAAAYNRINTVTMIGVQPIRNNQCAFLWQYNVQKKK